MFSHILSLCRDPMPAPYFLSCLFPKPWSLVKGLAFLELVPLSQKLYLHLPNMKGEHAYVFKVTTEWGISAGNLMSPKYLKMTGGTTIVKVAPASRLTHA